MLGILETICSSELVSNGDTGHKIGWNDAHIIDFETYFWPRKVKEAIWIKKPSGLRRLSLL